MRSAHRSLFSFFFTLRNVLLALKLRLDSYVTMEFERLSAEDLGRLELTVSQSNPQSGVTVTVDSIDEGIDDNAGNTIVNMNNSAPAFKTPLERRVQKRQERLDAVAQRDDRKFFSLVAVAFLLPAVVILAIAQLSGYLDKLQILALSGR